jgi:acid phosphatase type 7
MKSLRRCFGLFLVMLALQPVLLRAQAEITGVYLTWKGDPSTTMTVNWVSLYADAADTVWYRTGGAAWRKADGTRTPLKPSGLWVRRVQLTGLDPETRYDLFIGEEAPKEAPRGGFYHFRTLPRELKRPLSFVAGGDMMHTREMVDAMNKQAGRLDPDFALLGGDLAYADNVDATRWVDFFQSWLLHARGKQGRLIPMVVAIGNHEVVKGYKGRRDVEALQFYTLFDLPDAKAHYALDFGNYLSFVILDSDHTEPIAGAQAEWLDRTLAARATQTFVFPCYHFPAYGTAKGPGEGKLPIEHPRAIAIRTHWIPHFERHGVSAVFENDHHNYKRTHPLRGHKRDDENGIVYLGDGAWGVGTRTVPPLSEAWYLAKAEPIRHLYHVVLQPTGQAQIKAVNDKGEAFDSLELATPRTRPVSP